MPLSFWNRWGNNDIEPKIRFNMGFFRLFKLEVFIFLLHHGAIN